MDQTDVGLQSVVKALTETVAAAIDPADHPAREQLKLAASYVEFVRSRLHLLHARERFDLKHYVGLSRVLLPLAGTLPEANAVRGQLDVAEALLTDPAALTAGIRAGAAELAHAVAGLVKGAHAAGVADARTIDMAVIAASEERLEVQRRWYEPIGFEPAPLPEPALADLLK